MARTQTEILEAIRADFVANLTLQDAYGLDPEQTFLEQFSVVSIEAIITYIIASAIYLHELIVDQKATELDAKIGAEYFFTKDWYKSKFLAFQLGDDIVFDETTNKFIYAVTDEEKQIIKYVALRERQISGVTTLQVFLTKDGKVALSASELDAVAVYAEEIGAAGTHFQFISQNPDQLDVTMTVTYNPQVLNNIGVSFADGTEPAKLAVQSYLDGIKYSGLCNRTRLTDAVQKVTGVLDVVLGDVKMNDVLQANQNFESPSGFFEVEEANIHVTYIPGNENDY